jgi:hypothetical protein
MDRDALAKSRLYSKFSEHADTVALAEIIAHRSQLLDASLQEVVDNWRLVPDSSTRALPNEYLRQIAISVGYVPSPTETEAEMLPWVKGYIRAMLSWCNLEDLMYCTRIVFDDVTALMDGNEPGPTAYGTHNGLNCTTLESTTDLGMQVDSANKLNNLLGLLSTITEAGKHVYVSFDLRQVAYLTDAGTNNNYEPSIPRNADDGPAFAFDGYGGAHFDTGGFSCLISTKDRL